MKEKNNIMKVKKGAFNLPVGTIRDLIALIFSFGFFGFTFWNISNQNINEQLYTNFVNLTMVVIGYYFGNRTK